LSFLRSAGSAQAVFKIGYPHHVLVVIGTIAVQRKNANPWPRFGPATTAAPVCRPA
jgi:hypothetical protein